MKNADVVSTVATSQPAERRCIDSTTIASSDGTIHTQWCDQEVGDNSNPAAPVTTIANTAFRLRNAHQVPVTAAASTTAATSSHNSDSTSGGGPRPAKAPRAGWLGPA